MKTTLLDKLTKGNPILGINRRNLKGIYPHNQRRNFPNVDEKLCCKALLRANGIPVPKTYYTVKGLRDIRGWQSALDGIDRFVIKPNRGYGGGGIAPIVRTGSNFSLSNEIAGVEDLNFHIAQIINGDFARGNIGDIAFFEYYIDCDDFFSDLIPPDVIGVSDIRIIYLYGRPLMAMLRLPTRESGGHANLHQGGIGLGINMETGITGYGCHGNRVVETHPEMGTPLRGKGVPHFDKLLEMGTGIGKMVGLGYIGVDFVIDRKFGPMVLEVNARPGLNIQIANQAGLRSELDRNENQNI